MRDVGKFLNITSVMTFQFFCWQLKNARLNRDKTPSIEAC